MIYTKPEDEDLVIKVRQKPKADGSRTLPFKLQLKGKLPLKHLRNFVSLDVRRQAQQLHLEDFEVLGPILTRGGKKQGGRGSSAKDTKDKKNKS